MGFKQYPPLTTYLTRFTRLFVFGCKENKICYNSDILHHYKKKAVFTLSEGAMHVALPNSQRRAAFTLAEVLITLGIIGVVAAITIPTLIHKYKMQALEAQFKKAYSVVQNVNLMMKYNDIDPYVDYQVGVSPRDEDAIIKQAEDFAKFTNARICNDHYSTCFFGTSRPEGKMYKTLDGKTNAHIDPDAYTKRTIILPDGAIVWLGGTTFGKNRYYYDINGRIKGPNKLGYDLHVFDITKDGTISVDKNNGSTNKCSFKESAHGDAYLGFNCTYYALTNTNPDDESKNYWQEFLK